MFGLYGAHIWQQEHMVAATVPCTVPGKKKEEGPGPLSPSTWTQPVAWLAPTKHYCLKLPPTSISVADWDQAFNMQNLEDISNLNKALSLLSCLYYEQFQTELSLLQIYFIQQSTEYLKPGTEHESFYFPHRNNYTRWMVLNEYPLFHCRLWQRKCAKMSLLSHSGCYKKLP